MDAEVPGLQRKVSDVIPSRAELVGRAQALVPLLREKARETERNRRVSDETADMIREAGLFRVMQPVRFGGYEHSPGSVIDLTAELARGCGSTAWCYSIPAIHGWLLGQMDMQAQEDVWGSNQDALLCGSYAPATTAKRADGGYTISGRWSFTSGVDICDWAFLSVKLPPDADGKQGGAFFLVPKAQYKVEDTWDTVGLGGTGSKTMVIEEEIFVPVHRTVTFADLSSGNALGSKNSTNPIYRMPLMTVVPTPLASPAIGIVLAAVDEYVEWVSGRSTRGAVAGGGRAVVQFSHIQHRVAEAYAAVDTARLLLHRGINEVLDMVSAGQPIPVSMRLRNRRDHGYAVHLLRQAMNALFEGVGGSGLEMKMGIQRQWRDCNAVASHFSINWESCSCMYGQHVLGLEPQGQY